MGAGVTKDVEHSFWGRKAFTTQNVMAAVDFDLRFTYVLAGWEGSAHGATVLADALTRERGLQVPPGKKLPRIQNCPFVITLQEPLSPIIVF